MKYKVFVLMLLAVFVVSELSAQSVNLKQIGKANIYTRFRFAVHFNGALYSIDNTAALYKTDLSTGAYTRLGNVTYNNTKFFFNKNNRLYSIETDGSMNTIDPLSGTWSVIASIGTWSTIERVISVGYSFYAIENGGLFYYPTLNPRNRKQLGESEFFNLGGLYLGDTTLCTRSGDGNLYEISTTTGVWKKIGKKEWKYSKAGAVINDKLYTVETPSALFETTLSDGTRKQLDSTQFTKASFMFADSGKLYTITSEGTLFEISIN